MPTTPRAALRYPALSDAPNGPAQIANLANDTDTKMFINGGNSGVIAGAAPPAGQAMIMKTFRGTAATNSSGDTTVFFPGGAFPNGFVGLSIVPYATSVNCGMWSGSSTSFVNIRVWDGNSGLPVGALPALILHFTAWGW